MLTTLTNTSLAGFSIAAAALSGWAALGVGVDNAVEIWFVDDDPALLAYQSFQEEFGNDEVVAIAAAYVGSAGISDVRIDCAQGNGDVPLTVVDATLNVIAAAP